MSPEILAFIQATREVGEARQRLFTAECNLSDTRKALTEAFCSEGSQIPESFVVRYKDSVYVVQIDTEGDHGHQVKTVDAILD